ncbi:DNA excision repair protein ERCC-6 [Aphelenchoides besseyi]|nr:DNA excision repair protein ERCC-6 [Aphelenchoides besseyi]
MSTPSSSQARGSAERGGDSQKNPFDEDAEEDRVFNAEDGRLMDELVLGNNKRNGTTNRGDQLPTVGATVMHRRGIVEETNLADDVETFDVNVAAYNADRLESGLIRQAEDALDAAQDSEVTKKKPKKSDSAFQNVLQSGDAVKHGDKTPFEMMIQKQLEHERRQTEKRQEKRIAELQKANRPSTSAQSAKLHDDDFEPVDYSTESSDWITDDAEDEDETTTRKQKKRTKSKVPATSTKSKSRKAVKDDGNEEDFIERLREYHESQKVLQAEGLASDLDGDFHDIQSGYKVTSSIWNRLYKYQKTGVRWLHQLHEQYVGGILADEMGLGKTIQVAVLLRSIAESRQYSRIFDYQGLGPTLIIAPATLMHQWTRELHTWFPKCRVAVFHSSGSFVGSKKRLLQSIATPRSNGTVLITSYSTYTQAYKDFLKINWHYVICDEGHKIRNPDTRVTTTLKELRTPHRLLLTGSPMQNNLKELWSLIDFVYPGRLGSLKEFTDRFANPITQGGYANATKVQVRTAYKCACLLRDAINPYMLRRMKKDVEMVLNLPEKSEQVLFCDITEHQRELYKQYITSKEIRSILAGRVDAFAGLITLRKLCNHPDLITGGPNRHNEYDTSVDIDKEFGAACRSGKMIVVESLLKLWYKQGQKVLLFSQSKQMLTILEKLVLMKGYGYLRMDGGTPIGSRQPLESDIFVFLLTTRVGGLGLNLTSANRVLIYDPDWNPNAQARERAWRIGQNRSVTIYRLMTSGTIEEKIYQRQIFKQFLANRILVDPKQKRFFKTNDLQELFTLGDERTDLEHGTETAAIFSDQPTEINKKNFFDERAKRKEKEKKSKRGKKSNADEEDEENEEDISDVENIEITLTDDYKAELREKAREYIRLMSQKNDLNEQPSTSPAVDSPTSTIDDVKPNVEEGELLSDQEQLAAPTPEVNELSNVESKEDKQSKKKKKHDKKEKRKSKKRLLDGKFEIRYLRKQRDYKAPTDPDGESSRDQDDYVLGHLLKSAGVHSAIRHDHILGETSVEREDMQLVEEEAEAVARRAAEVLKRAHRQHENFVQHACASSKSVFGRRKATIPTEEEKKPDDDEDPNDQLPSMFNGGMKQIGRRSGGTLSSSELSNAIKKRRMEQLEELTACDDEANLDPETRMYPSLAAKEKKLDISLNDKYEKLAEEIRLFFVSRDGRSTSNEVVSRFKSKVPSQDAFVFRSILRRLCLQLPNSHWALRSEYR